MRKSTITAVVLIALVAVGSVVIIAALNSNKSNNASMTQSTDNAVSTSQVEIKGYAFTPAVIKVKIGTKVTWTNKDSVGHTVTTDDGAPTNIDSAPFSDGQTYSYTFSKAGTYHYHCTPHPYMHGTVVVE